MVTKGIDWEEYRRYRHTLHAGTAGQCPLSPENPDLQCGEQVSIHGEAGPLSSSPFYPSDTEGTSSPPLVVDYQPFLGQRTQERTMEWWQRGNEPQS